MRHYETKNVNSFSVIKRPDDNKNRKSCSDYLQDRSFASDMHVVFIYTAHVTNLQCTGFPPCNQGVLDNLPQSADAI